MNWKDKIVIMCYVSAIAGAIAAVIIAIFN